VKTDVERIKVSVFADEVLDLGSGLSRPRSGVIEFAGMDRNTLARCAVALRGRWVNG
jgi:hypothetical protein